MLNKIFKQWQPAYDGFEYANIYEVVKETPKFVVLRLMSGRGLRSDLTLYIKGKYDTKPLTDEFIEKRISKNALKEWEWTDITEKFEDGNAWYFYR